MTKIFKAIYRCHAVSIKLPMMFFYRIRTTYFKISMEIQKTLNSQNNLRKEKDSWRNHSMTSDCDTKLQ